MIPWLLQKNLEALSLLAQVNRKMDFGYTTSFHEIKKEMIEYNPAYINQAKPR